MKKKVFIGAAALLALTSGAFVESVHAQEGQNIVNIAKKKKKKSNKKEWNESANKEFSTFFMTAINEILASQGTDMRIQTKYFKDGLIYVVLPQEVKYSTETEKQRIVDNMLEAKNSGFDKWTKDNKIEVKEFDRPQLIVETPDGETIAEESVVSRTMKLK